MEYFDFVIIGGGIAGVVCAETLCELISPSPYSLPDATTDRCRDLCARVCLVSASPRLKTTVNVRHVTRMLESFDVAEKTSDEWSRHWPGVLTVFVDKVEHLE